MAVVFGPAFSISARKTIGKAITYQKRFSGFAAIGRPRPKQKNKTCPTYGQTTQRDYYGEAVGYWRKLSPSERENWNAFIKMY